MARQRDPAGMEEPPGCEPDGLAITVGWSAIHSSGPALKRVVRSVGTAAPVWEPGRYRFECRCPAESGLLLIGAVRFDRRAGRRRPGTLKMTAQRLLRLGWGRFLAPRFFSTRTPLEF